MRFFRWLSVGPIPTAYDLRRLGWQLLVDERSSGRWEGHAQLGRLYDIPMPQWLTLTGANLAQRKWMMMIDVPESQDRARLLRLGFGDALGYGSSLDELESRVLRLAQHAEALPRYRQHGAVQLDLLARDALVAGRAVGLHPREFALLWRLAECPGEAVGTPELLYDVWRLSFRPETNSLAVHLSRLRAKLRTAGVDGLVETLPGGCYRLSGGERSPTAEFALDDYARLREEPYPTLAGLQDHTVWT
ncbi:MAG: winged helix-turn-helix domain-containing protein [Novosphingobium sp.]